jgi:hypothetical protein
MIGYDLLLTVMSFGQIALPRRIEGMVQVKHLRARGLKAKRFYCWKG